MVKHFTRRSAGKAQCFAYYAPQVDHAGKLSRPSRDALRRIDLHLHDPRHEAGSRLIKPSWPVGVIVPGSPSG
jgi:hypothetical protein